MEDKSLCFQICYFKMPTALTSKQKNSQILNGQHAYLIYKK